LMKEKSLPFSLVPLVIILFHCLEIATKPQDSIVLQDSRV
jgi:hypothetical protein